MGVAHEVLVVFREDRGDSLSASIVNEKPTEFNRTLWASEPQWASIDMKVKTWVSPMATQG
jgi:hypothetical protein